MGVCDSVINNKKEQNVNKLKENSLIPDKICILPENLTVRDDISKYYSLAPQFIGHGASGVVYEAFDKDGKKYAIKQINKNAIKDIKSVMLEAEISLSLSHEYIVKCYQIFEDYKTISFVLELIEGGDLFSFITTGPNGRLSNKDSLELIIQILQTIKYLHMEKNITHRDIKPQNFLVRIEKGVPKIKMIDFGFARHIPKDHFMEDILGSPFYLAPEIVEGVHYNKNVDIWSAGVILYNMLTGDQPFSQVDLEATNEDILYKKINFAEIENIKLRELCQGMLERHPEFRLSAENALKMAQSITIIQSENCITDSSPDNNFRNREKMPSIIGKDCMKGVFTILKLNDHPIYTNTPLVGSLKPI